MMFVFGLYIFLLNLYFPLHPGLGHNQSLQNSINIFPQVVQRISATKTV